MISLNLQDDGTRQIIAEAILLFIFFFSFMHYGLGNLTNYRLNNQYPPNYGAQDAYLYSAYSAYAIETGQVRTMDPYLYRGTKDLALFLPPLRIIGESGVSYLAGTSVYDSIYIMVIFCVFLAIMAFYLLLRSYKKEVAMLSLPLAFLIFRYPFSTSFFWGIWSLSSGIMYLPVLLYFIRFHDRKFYVPIMILLAAGQLMSYLRITPFIYIFILGYYGYLLWKKEIRLSKELPRLAIIAVGTLLLCCYFISLLNVSFGVFTDKTASAFLSQADPIDDNTIAVPLFTQLGIINILIIALGFASLAFPEKKDYSLILLVYLFLLMFSNYLFFGIHVFKLRLFWPIYASGLFGLGLAFLFSGLSYLIPKLKRGMPIICPALSIILILVYASTYSGAFPTYFADQDLNNGYLWLKANTSADSKILYFYGDLFVQASYLVSERDSYIIDLEALKAQAQKTSIFKKIKLLPEPYSQTLRRRGLFDRELVTNQETLTKLEKGELGDNTMQDLCSYDYFVFGVKGRHELLSQNARYHDQLIKDGNSEVYSNSLLNIVKNKRGLNCIDETN
jgi:hypothetical protein